MTIDPLTYTREQAAEALQISPSLIQRLIQRHEIPVVHLGDRVLIPISALETFLDEQALATVRREAVTNFLTGVEDTKPLDFGLAGRRTPRNGRTTADNKKRRDRSNDLSASKD